MKHLVSFFVIILITFSFNNAKSEDLLIAYINMEKVMNETIAGKYLVEQLEEIHKSKNSYSSYLTSTDKDYDIILPNIEKINIRSVAQAKRNRAVKIAKENHAIAVEENTNKKKKTTTPNKIHQW